MGWKDDAIFLEKYTCPELVQALAEVAMHRPRDPISYLAHKIYKNYHNREQVEIKDVWKEHLELERTMGDFNDKIVNERVCIKFAFNFCGLL